MIVRHRSPYWQPERPNDPLLMGRSMPWVTPLSLELATDLPFRRRPPVLTIHDI